MTIEKVKVVYCVCDLCAPHPLSISKYSTRSKQLWARDSHLSLQRINFIVASGGAYTDEDIIPPLEKENAHLCEEICETVLIAKGLKYCSNCSSNGICAICGEIANCIYLNSFSGYEYKLENTQVDLGISME